MKSGWLGITKKFRAVSQIFFLMTIFGLNIN